MDDTPARREPASPTSEDVQALVQSLLSDAEVKRRELELQAQWQEHNFDYANRALEAQERDRDRERAHDWRKTMLRYGFATFTVLVLAAFLIVAFRTGNQQIALDLLKVALGAVAGGGFVFGYRRSKAAQIGDPS